MDEKFLSRGKRKDNGEWIKGIYFPDCNSIISYLEIGSLDISADLMNCKAVVHKVNSKTVGRCTGLIDKNKVRIFEGDIISISRIDEVDGLNLGIVCFGRHGACYYSKTEMGFYIDWSKSKDNLLRRDICFWAESCEVIGNIHDNPELLKGTCEPCQNT